MQGAFPPYIDPSHLDDLIDRALAEDVGSGDVTTLATIPEQQQAEAHFLLKEEGVVAGLLVAEHVFSRLDAALVVEWTRGDGAFLPQGTVFGHVRGAARPILEGERLALNLLQRMSGIATLTRRMVEACAGHSARILDTRKTAPGLRTLDKWAVRLGGGENHRIGLYDRILIKDNHIDASGGVREAIRSAKRWREANAPSLEIEVEARTLDEVAEALREGGVDYLLLDNMARRSADGQLDTSLLAEAVQYVNLRARTEASGNVTLETVAAIAATGVDYISCGFLTHSVRALDISMKIGLKT